MKGTTRKIVHADYKTLIHLDSGKCLATRHDGGPHFFIATTDAAEKLFSKSKEWGHDRTRYADDNWEGHVEFGDDVIAIAEARSATIYNEDGTRKASSSAA